MRPPPPPRPNLAELSKGSFQKMQKTRFLQKLKQNTRTVQLKKRRNCCLASSLDDLSEITERGPDLEPISKGIFEKCIFQKTRSKSIGFANEKLLVFAFSKVP